MTTIALTLDRVNLYDTAKLTVAIQSVGNLFDPNAVAETIDGSPVARQQALDAAARLIHADAAAQRAAEVATGQASSPEYRKGMRDLILELFGADDLDDDAGRTYVDQELRIRLRRLAS